MEYLEFWTEHGLNWITPKGIEWPEGFNVGQVLKNLMGYHDSILEVGCGPGRLAGAFHPTAYIGVDINPAAIAAARAKWPGHVFYEVGLDGKLPARDVVLLYTVALHIPDELLKEQFKRFTDAAVQELVIAEIMDPTRRTIRREGYDLSNQRSVGEYITLMETFGFYLSQRKMMPYEYYPGREITFLQFTRR